MHICGSSAVSPVYAVLQRLLCVFVLLTVLPAFSANVPLVDDDNNAPDVRGSYTAALGVLGVSYDTWDTGDTANEPGAVKLSGYDAAIYKETTSYRTTFPVNPFSRSFPGWSGGMGQGM